ARRCGRTTTFHLNSSRPTCRLCACEARPEDTSWLTRGVWDTAENRHTRCLVIRVSVQFAPPPCLKNRSDSPVAVCRFNRASHCNLQFVIVPFADQFGLLLFGTTAARFTAQMNWRCAVETF